MTNSRPLATIAIPTSHRSAFIKDALLSALSQTVDDTEIIVVDNGADDVQTCDIVRSYAEPRVVYCRSSRTLDVIACWNECVALAKGEYILILGDDDRLKPTFLERSIAAMETSTNIGLTFTHANKTDLQWNILQLWGYDFPPAGLLMGNDYLEFTLRNACCISLASTVLIRKTVHDTIGRYARQYAHNTFDFNFYLRVAEQFDTFFIDEVLVDYRLHAEQLSEAHWRRPSQPTGKIGTYLELLGVISRLMTTKTFDNTFLEERLGFITEQLANRLQVCIPHL